MMMHHKLKRALLNMSEISLTLDTYDDIFSDFDPRPYSERAVSEDLLTELRRASRDKASGGIELTFLIPKHERSLKDEKIIENRLREHFKRHHGLLRKEQNQVIKYGLLFAVIGVALMFLTAAFLFENAGKSYLNTFLLVLLEPAGWFLFWEGFEQILEERKRIKPELMFYDKMCKSEIEFIEY